MAPKQVAPPLALSAQQLSYRVNGATLLHDVSLSVQAGEVLALVGQNGAGKSTLLKLLSGDLPPTAGEVHLGERPLQRIPPQELALRRAVMSQGALVAFEFTAYEVAMMGRYPHQRFGVGSGAEDAAIVQAALQETETAHLRERLFPTLSGGEAARVTLARVLAQRTPFLLLDEPTAPLDLRHQQMVMQIARRLAAAGAGLLLVLHDLNLAAAYADRVGVMQGGEVLALGTPNEVLTESSIQAAFGLPVQVLRHPQRDCPLIVPLEA